MSETNTKLTNPLDKVDWDDVLDTLEQQKCVLFLGSSVFSAPGGGGIETALRQWLDTDNPEHPFIQVHNPDGFFLFKKNRYKRKVIAEMKRFYSQSFPETETQFGRLARIPFSMIFTLTPDNILARIFDVMGFEYQPDFYFRNRRATDKFENPRKDKPLIYNLLGNIEEPESLVLTHSDFFDYLESVFKGNSMSADLKDELEGMERYIFLGLPYEKWYFQLLLRVLSMHSDRLKEIERLALKEFEDPRLHKIYTEEFKIEFFPANTEEFIGELYRRCETADLLKALPAVDPALAKLPDPAPDELRELVAKAEMKTAMLHLNVYLNYRKPRSAELANDLIVLRNQFNLLSQRELRGTIDSRDLSVEYNQIAERLLDLITQAQKL
ncbi:MAG: hypothetical protein DHS20C18_17070 [Saprospiraceae bacterium]|nr:MAG: hypothetical protein DHS20C18_17070 [Saprospiraceae bacterium]